MSIFIGFEVPTGRRIEIPSEGHVAVFGQTQLSGKTTFIEAMVSRAPANVKAVAFITKRGEGSFLTAKMVSPYFSEPTNDPEQPLWRWVSAILEASQKRALRFEESWLIRACEEPKRAKSLADVHSNIISLIEGEGEYYQKTKKKRVWRVIRKPVTGINQGVYTSLKAYFDIVMPQLARMPYTKTLDLKPGLNVMDLREYSMEAQGMVIRSVMEYVYRHERNCRVIVPEAQDFVPQGKNSPVKMACETMVRKGAADKNFMWLDSQDMAAVDKVMLRAVSILACGVQGEAHEMNRSIAHLFGAATRLTPRDIGSLKIGQFYLRLAGGDVTKVYVQPVFMDSEVHARAIAMGQESVSSARQILSKFKKDRDATEAQRRRDPHQQLQIQEAPDEQEEQASSTESDGEFIGRGSSENERRLGTDDSLSSGSISSAGMVGNVSTEKREERPKEKTKHSRTDWLKRGLGDFTPQPGDGYIYPEGGRLKETLVGGDGVVRHFDHDTGLPWDSPVTSHQPPSPKRFGGGESPVTNLEVSHVETKPERAERTAGPHDDQDRRSDGAAPGRPGDAGSLAGDGRYSGPRAGAAGIDDEELSDAEAEEEMSFQTRYERLVDDYNKLKVSHDTLTRRIEELLDKKESLDGAESSLGAPGLRGGNGAAAATKMAPAAPDTITATFPSMDFIYAQMKERAATDISTRFSVADLEDLYDWVKTRASADPGILQLLQSRPELRVTVQRTVIQLEDSTLAGKVACLISKGFFDKPAGVAATQKELKRLGSEQPTTNVRRALDKLNEQGFLTAEADGFQAVKGMKVNLIVVTSG